MVKEKLTMRALLFAIISMFCINIKAQTYNFENEKSYLGYIRQGEEVCLTDNPNQKFSFSYLPGGGDKPYAQGIYFFFASNEKEFTDYMNAEGKEVYTITITLDDDKEISHSYDVVQHKNGSWGSAPIEATFTDQGFGVACMFPLIKYGTSTFTFTNKTKPKHVMEWNNYFKFALTYHDIKSIEVVALCDNPESDKKDRYVFHYDITKPTTYIFKSLMYDFEQ